MSSYDEIHAFLLAHLETISENDIERYHATTSEDLTLYEWWVTPHRIDGLPFHDFMMEANAARGTVFGADNGGQGEGSTGKSMSRFDLSNLAIQRFGKTAIASYTLLISTPTAEGVRVAAHNESRVMVEFSDGWKVVHVHKSPAWRAPHSP
jgi:hypothetical protein